MIPSSRSIRHREFPSTTTAPHLTGDPVHNAIVTRPNISDSNQYNVRIDEQLGNKDSLFFGYSHRRKARQLVDCPATTGGFETGRLVRAGWNHVSPQR